MKWIARQNIKVDRVACPWLIRRFIDPDAEFLIVEEDQLLRTAAAEQAIPFDAPSSPEIKLNHRGNRCSFEAVVDDYRLNAPGLAKLVISLIFLHLLQDAIQVVGFRRLQRRELLEGIEFLLPEQLADGQHVPVV